MFSKPRRLLILGCSETKLDVGEQLPAIYLYDGPAFRVLRRFLRDHGWPEGLFVAVLSAKYGLIGGLSLIAAYDRRMTPARAAELAPEVGRVLSRWRHEYAEINLFLGRDYLPAIGAEAGDAGGLFRVFEGPIGVKLHALRVFLDSFGRGPRKSPVEPARGGRLRYFLPDWDDFLDVNYDFQNDVFSAENRDERVEAHGVRLVQPHQLCDGLLVSLAQQSNGKGPLSQARGRLDEGAPAPVGLRERFGLSSAQWLFGDCGAFSYVAADEPFIGVAQAAALYELYGFDFGASVDHIPVAAVGRGDEKRLLSATERRRRVRLTRDNAERFLNLHRAWGANFLPVGVIQGLGVGDYAQQLGEYVEMGYHYIALGGLVLRSDAEIQAIVEALTAVRATLRQRPWIHLFGVFRPRLQAYFGARGIDSFDSATYFRKAWLRSDQNYLGVDGDWYAAIRIPPQVSVRMQRRMSGVGVSDKRLAHLETAALAALRDYDAGRVDVATALEAVMAYDRLLPRGVTTPVLRRQYHRTLEVRPWRACDCPICRQLGVEVIIFRGTNRNKRRGFHNTLQLFRQVHRVSGGTAHGGRCSSASPSFFQAALF